MKKLNWIYVGVGAVVLYFVWKKLMNTDGANYVATNNTLNDTIRGGGGAVSSDVTQGDMVNNLALASGRVPTGVTPCFCKGETQLFLGWMNRHDCKKACRKADKFEQN